MPTYVIASDLVAGFQDKYYAIGSALNETKDLGGEGLMLRKNNSVYEGKRSKSLITDGIDYLMKYQTMRRFKCVYT